jgi:hypothetical protein
MSADYLVCNQRLDQGARKKSDCDLGVFEVTVGDWRRKRAEIEKWCSQRASVCNSKNLNRMHIITSMYSNPLYSIFNLIFNNLPNLPFNRVFDYPRFLLSTLHPIIETLLYIYLYIYMRLLGFFN